MTDVVFEPLVVPSLKQACIHKLESMILSGELKAGEKLPSERVLALQLNVSRPVLHQALVDLALKGLVEIQPRRGVYINDFRTHGSLALLSSLITFQEGILSPELTRDMTALRRLLEGETARLAAKNRSQIHLESMKTILNEETQIDRTDIPALVKLDFSLHIQIALASENTIYALLLNSIADLYTSFTTRFFINIQSGPELDKVFDFHRRLVAAIADQNSEAARILMEEMLDHGAAHTL